MAMAKILRSSWPRRIDLGETFVANTWLKWASKKILAAAAFSTVAIDGLIKRGAS